ncbi:hypothetical protein [Desulfopila inferna]|uniref:hypothetical protein n=1 Tax=Desulfopila inferna TaxID=468528 RepID=UPI001965B779|nr:hypothetical protein [Desulfopila inferna]MBM9605486.1 hypothetical protein [Desulfopila inferna]
MRYYSWNTPQGNGGIDFGYPIIHFWGRELAISIMKNDSDRRKLEKNNWIFDDKEDLLQSIFRPLQYILFDADIVTGVTAFLEQTSETQAEIEGS